MTDDDARAVMRHIDKLHERLDDVYGELAEHRRLMTNMVRPGKLKSYDAKAALGIADVGFETRPLKWFEHASSGGITSWRPPAPGQHVMMLSPGGEPGNGLLLPYGYTTDNPSPSSDPKEHVVAKHGDVRLAHTDKSWTFAVGNQSLVLDASGLTAKVKSFQGQKA